MITPLDIRQRSFTKALRGIDADEVRAFLTALAQDWEQMQTRLTQAERRTQEAETKLKQYQDMEQLLRSTLQQAEQSAKHQLEQVERQAKLRMEQAEQEAQSLLAEARARKRTLEHDVDELEGRRAHLMDELKLFLTLHLERLNRLESGQPIQQAAVAEANTNPKATSPQPSAQAPLEAEHGNSPIDEAQAEAKGEAQAPAAPRKTPTGRALKAEIGDRAERAPVATPQLLSPDSRSFFEKALAKRPNGNGTPADELLKHL